MKRLLKDFFLVYEYSEKMAILKKKSCQIQLWLVFGEGGAHSMFEVSQDVISEFFFCQKKIFRSLSLQKSLRTSKILNVI